MAAATMNESHQVESVRERPVITQVVITGIHVPFGNAVGTCLKWGLAAIIAGFLLGFLGIPLWIILAAIASA